MESIEILNELSIIKKNLNDIQKGHAALQARCDRYEKVVKEHSDLNLALAAMLNGYQNLSMDQKDWFTVPKDLINEYTKMVLEYDAQDNEAVYGDGERGILKVGLKFRNKSAPLCSYEVVKIFPETKEFKVKETRECQVSGTTCHEVWSIEGFEKYYKLGVYYIQKEDKQ